MPAATIMAEEGAPIPKDEIDPELVKLKGPRPKVGLITSAGLVFLSLMFLWRLNPDRRFAGNDTSPARVSVADVLGGQVGADRYITVDADPVVSHAIRATASKGSLGLRVVPARGTGERLWVVLSGDGWENPTIGGYTGRLRRLSDLPFDEAVRDFAREHPQPAFATVDEVRAGFATGKVKTVGGDEVAVSDKDRIAYDVVIPDASVIVCTLNERFPNEAAWHTALDKAGITANATPAAIPEEARFETKDSVANVKAKLEKAELWAARVDPVTRHQDTTWGALKTTEMPPSDLVGLYVSRGIPSDAYALITGEKPDEYWYVLPVTIALALIALVFAWALVRAVRRDLLPAKVS